MNSTTLTSIHVFVVTIFILIYLIKTILLFASISTLDKFTKATKVIEMIISALFLITGVWLFVMLGAIKMFQIIKLVCVLASIPLAVIGFKKHNKALAVLSLLLIVGSYGLAEMSKKKPYLPNKIVVNNDEGTATPAGIRTFAANCAMCHGMDGKKQYREATDLSSSVSGDVRIDTLIRKGSKGKMPAFSGTLSDEEITNVAAYILTLRGR